MSSFQIQTELKGVQTSPLHYVSKDDIPDLFSPRKLEVTFKSFKKGKAPGPDGIDTEVLQNLDGISLGRLALIYNVSLAWVMSLKGGGGAKAILIPKVGKSVLLLTLILPPNLPDLFPFQRNGTGGCLRTWRRLVL